MPTTDSQNQPPSLPPPNARLRPERSAASHRSRRGLWFAVAALAAVLAVLGAWYAPLVGRHDRLFTALRSIPPELEGLRDRLMDAEARLSTLRGEVRSLREQVSGTQKSLNVRLEQVRRGFNALASSVRRDVHEALESRERLWDGRFRELEESQRSETLRAASLERELHQLRQRLTAVAQDVTYVQNAAALDSQRLRREVRGTDRRLTQVVKFSNRPRERFEVSKGQTYEITPGILLHISHTDARYRRFKGWLQLAEPAKILWLRDESVLQPVAFHAGKQTLRHDLVVTGLSSGGVSGYLMLPAPGESRREELLVSAAAPDPTD